MCKKEEYMVKVWGGAWSENADPSIEKDYGIKEGSHYFDTKEEKDKFVSILNKPVYRKQGMMMYERYGEMTHKRTIFVGTFEYKGNKFTIHYDLGYEYPDEDAEFYFTDGNFGCDCNRSLAIQWEYGEDVIPKLECGCEIELIDYHIEHWD